MEKDAADAVPQNRVVRKIFFIIYLTFLLISSIMHTTNEMPLRALSNGGITFDKKPSR